MLSHAAGLDSMALSPSLVEVAKLCGRLPLTLNMVSSNRVFSLVILGAIACYLQAAQIIVRSAARSSCLLTICAAETAILR